MATISWPASLPSTFLYNAYTEKFGDNTIVSEMDAGPPKVRKRSNSKPDEFRGSMVMTSDQVDTLRTFWKTTCQDGSLKFDWKHPRTAEAKEAMFIPGEPPDISASVGPDGFLVTLNVWVWV